MHMTKQHHQKSKEHIPTLMAMIVAIAGIIGTADQAKAESKAELRTLAKELFGTLPDLSLIHI